jgi:DNA-binding NarL/FixJ family response regulator
VNSEDQIRILVVDDHPVVRDGLSLIIESQSDMKLIGEAGTGLEALSLYALLQPDVTLLDLKLPDMSGIIVIEKLRALDPSARVIVLTTYVGDVQAGRALKAGASGYLLKAALRRDLRTSIRAVHRGERHVQAEVAFDLANHTGAETLTQRELDVLQLIARGCSNKIVADRLGIREDTVKSHVTSILYKLGASDRTHAVTIALQRGFFEI